jgi:hypothetical protein
MFIGPVVAPLGTVATNVGGVAWNEVAGVPLKDTDVVVENPTPVKVTWQPATPAWGENETNSTGAARRTDEMLPAASYE